MERLDPSALQVVGGILTLVVLFVLREFASGALKKAGEEFWVWGRRRRTRRHASRSEPRDTAGPSAEAAAGRRRREYVENGVADDRSPCLLPLGRGEADAAAIRRLPLRRNAPPESRRKSA
jgi:hypothetical protein